MAVTETFFAILVADMDRAIAFYTRAFGATVSHKSPGWTSTHVAGVRIGLVPGEQRGYTGVHFAVDDLAAAHAAVEAAGGRIVLPATEVAPGVVISVVGDTEGNELTLRG